jgi:hypothetical protein
LDAVVITAHTFKSTVTHKLNKYKSWNYKNEESKILLIKITWQDYSYTILDNGAIKSVMILTDGNVAITFHDKNIAMYSRQLIKNEDSFDDLIND